MARAIIRPLPLYFNGKKIAEVSDGSYDITSNDEAHIATEGYFGHSDGATTSKVNPNCVIPVRGMQTTVIDVLLNKRYVQMGIPVDGKFHQVDMRCVSANYKWDHKNGSMMGSFAFEGGEPDLAGPG